MAKIAVIIAPVDINAILRHLNLWEEPPARGPPAGGTVYEPCYDDLPAAVCGPAETPDSPAAADEQVFPDPDTPRGRDEFPPLPQSRPRLRLNPVERRGGIYPCSAKTRWRCDPVHIPG